MDFVKESLLVINGPEEQRPIMMNFSPAVGHSAASNKLRECQLCASYRYTILYLSTYSLTGGGESIRFALCIHTEEASRLLPDSMTLP